MSATDFARNKELDYMFGATAYTPPTNYYVGLSTTTISTSGSNATEPSGGAYARVLVPNDKSHFTIASTGCLVISGSVGFPESSGSWGTILAVGLWDASTSGSIWHYTTLGTPRIVQASTVLSFSSSAISFSMT